jgi:DNA repair protein RecN (Recombination protein N)
MLSHLLIKDLAVVAFADLHFSSGMTVITGETGAGKSILLDALGLALGQRSDSQLIRPHAEKAEITATFDISALPGAVLWLAELELTGEPPQQCIIRRILYATGRSKAFINGNPVTTQQLRLLGDHIVQIHGQHQHQLLLKSSEQLRILDAFGQHGEILSQVKTAYQSLEKCLVRQQKLQEASQQEQAFYDLLQYQIAELESLQITEQELLQLEQEHDKLAHAQSDIQCAEKALGYLDHPEAESVLVGLGLTLQTLKPLRDRMAPLKNAYECLELAQIQVKEAAGELNHYIHHLEINPARLEQIDRRLEKIYEMARKHKVEPTMLYQHYQTLLNKVKNIADLSESLLQLEEDIHLAKAQYQQCADQLTLKRAQAAKKLAKEVTKCIEKLGMNGAIFTVDCVPYSQDELHLLGNESVTFGFSANPGHAPQPLSKVASGGELSRISLALELITSQYLATPSLVFDEVDVGISGKTGAIVGHALHELGQSAQVFCVTHLPQVAAQGDHHIQVIKTQSHHHTETVIRMLNSQERIEEIARMLGGVDVTEEARAHAKALLALLADE